MNRKKFLQQLSIIAALPLLDNCTTKEKKAAATENKNENYIRLLRHATLVIQINGIRILVDPMLSDKDAMNAFKNTPNDFRNPMVALPVSKDELEILLANTDAVLLTHTHTDHWDKAAKKMIDSNKTILCQPADTNTLKESGFKNIITIEQQTDYKGISIHRTGAQHGRGEILKQMGTVSGYVLQNGAKKIYVAGDSVWCDDVKAAIHTHKPDIIIVNAGGAQFLTGGAITMMPEDVINTANELPTAQLIAVHMNAINHCIVKRKDLKAELEKNNLAARVALPEDGEKIAL